MSVTNYKVKEGRQVTVHKKVGDLTDPITGRVIGIQQGAGKTYFEGEVIPEHLVSPLLIEALENEDHPSHKSVSSKIEAVSDDPREDVGIRSGVPFDGYEELGEDEILAAMAVLPSSTIRSIQRYEKEQGDGRSRIVDYSIGNAQSPRDRIEGRAGSQLDPADTDKTVGKITTREVSESDVRPGEGITGTGDPDIPPGTLKENAEANPDSSDDQEGGSNKPVAKKPAARRNRRSRS